MIVMMMMIFIIIIVRTSIYVQCQNLVITFLVLEYGNKIPRLCEVRHNRITLSLIR